MKFGYVCFSFLTMFGFCFWESTAKTCPAGEYLLTGKCYNCPAGCYCTGNDGKLDPKNKISVDEVKAYCNSGKKCSHSGSDGYGDCGKSWNARLYRCADLKDSDGNTGNFANSGQASKSYGSCYGKINGTSFYYTKIACAAGNYLPAGSGTCQTCKAYEECPGGSWYPSVHDQGRTDNSIKCIAGTYLAANTKNCAACPEGYVCSGGEWGQQAIDQGKRKCSGNTIPNEQRTNCVSCPAGKKANEGNTECVDAEIFVPAGKYLPANRVQPADCIGDTKYCPGGYYMKKSVEQGRFDCPYGSRFTNNHKQCSLKLTKENMQYGPLGTESAVPCWMITNEVAYKDCVFGAKNDD